MGEDVELWGTFSVNDHMRRRAFVAEVLLYDRLVIPVPPPDDEEYDRWRDNRWQPGRQRRLVEILGEADCLVEIPAVKLASRSEFRERRADFHSRRRQISAAEGGREKAVRELERRLSATRAQQGRSACEVAF